MRRTPRGSGAWRSGKGPFGSRAWSPPVSGARPKTALVFCVQEAAQRREQKKMEKKQMKMKQIKVKAM